jgi:hypothetical protein
MKPRTRYWTIHWLRVVLWPLPVMTLTQGLACTIRCHSPATNPASLGRMTRPSRKPSAATFVAARPPPAHKRR